MTFHTCLARSPLALQNAGRTVARCLRATRVSLSWHGVAFRASDVSLRRHFSELFSHAHCPLSIGRTGGRKALGLPAFPRKEFRHGFASLGATSSARAESDPVRALWLSALVIGSGCQSRARLALRAGQSDEGLHGWLEAIALQTDDARRKSWAEAQLALIP